MEDKYTTIQLNIPERFMLIELLPEMGNFVTLKTVELLKENIYPSEEEVNTYEIKQDDKIISWNKEAINMIDLEFTDVQIKFLISKFTDLSDKDELKYTQFILYKKFNKDAV